MKIVLMLMVAAAVVHGSSLVLKVGSGSIAFPEKLDSIFDKDETELDLSLSGAAQDSVVILAAGDKNSLLLAQEGALFETTLTPQDLPSSRFPLTLKCFHNRIKIARFGILKEILEDFCPSCTGVMH